MSRSSKKVPFVAPELMKRIEAQISLEKHITALEVLIGVVTESKASIPDEHLEALMAGDIDSLTFSTLNFLPRNFLYLTSSSIASSKAFNWFKIAAYISQ